MGRGRLKPNTSSPSSLYIVFIDSFTTQTTQICVTCSNPNAVAPGGGPGGGGGGGQKAESSDDDFSDDDKEEDEESDSSSGFSD